MGDEVCELTSIFFLKFAVCYLAMEAVLPNSNVFLGQLSAYRSFVSKLADGAMLCSAIETFLLN